MPSEVIGNVLPSNYTYKSKFGKIVNYISFDYGMAARGEMSDWFYEKYGYTDKNGYLSTVMSKILDNKYIYNNEMSLLEKEYSASSYNRQKFETTRLLTIRNMYDQNKVMIEYNKNTNIMTIKYLNSGSIIIIDGNNGTMKDINNNVSYTEINYENLAKIANDNNLSNAERLKLAQGAAYTNKILDVNADLSLRYRQENGDPSTYCNAYAAYVTYLYTGSTDLMGGWHGKNGEFATLSQQGKTPKDVGYFRNVNSATSWAFMNVDMQMQYFRNNNYNTGLNVMDGMAIQEKINRGMLIYGAEPNHIVVGSPGDYKIGFDADENPYKAFAIAQQGRSSYFNPLTDNGHVNYSWSKRFIQNVYIYYK